MKSIGFYDKVLIYDLSILRSIMINLMNQTQTDLVKYLLK